MRLLLALAILLAACSSESPAEQIQGTWYYSNAESLGNNVANDAEAKKAFDKAQGGQKLRFNRDSTWRNYTMVGKEDLTVREGKYSLNAEGDRLTISDDETVKIALQGDVLKIYSPDNAVFVWRRLK